MKDLLLTKDGDLQIDCFQGVSITDSVAQAIRIRLLWFFNEWRFSPDFGIPYFEKILVKNPNNLRIIQIMREEIMSVDEVEAVKNIKLTVNNDRTAKISFKATINGEDEDMVVMVNV